MKDWPGPLARRFQQIAVAVFHAEVSAAGSDLTPVQFAALSEVRAHPGIDQATLAGLIAFDRTTTSGVVDRLVHKGLLARQVSPTDRRARTLAISARGRRLLEQIEPAVRRAQDVMLSGLDGDEATEFIRLLSKAVSALNDLSRAPLQADPA